MSAPAAVLSPVKLRLAALRGELVAGHRRDVLFVVGRDSGQQRLRECGDGLSEQAT